MTNVLVYVQILNNDILPVTYEIISYLRHNFLNCKITGVVLGDSASIHYAKDSLYTLPIDALYIIKNDKLLNAETNTFAVCLEQIINEIKPDIFLMGATSFGRELAPRVASKLDIGLTADCTQLALDNDGKLLATRPTYGGKMMATIFSNTIPNFATVRPGTFKSLDFNNQFKPDILKFSVNLDNIENRIELIKSELIKSMDDWTKSDIIVAGGLGLQSKENFNMIYDFADKIGAKPAASRAAVERGWASHSIQVGQTGVSVSPKLYIAFGISGAMQHIVGINNADKIIAINTDENAPIMSIANISMQVDAISLLRDLLS